VVSIGWAPLETEKGIRAELETEKGIRAELRNLEMGQKKPKKLLKLGLFFGGKMA